MVNLKRIITEIINEYIDYDSGIQAVIFDFDYTLVDTSALRGIDRNYIRQTNDISQLSELIPQTKVYNGISELLAYLYQNGIKVGVVSNRHESIINAVLKYHGIKVNVVIGERLNCEKSIRMKDALSKLGVEASNAVYVGDSPWDNAEAHKAGMEFIGATWGSRKLKMGYNNPMEIIKYIEYINN
jgi:phosphoglycolate phosphatase-like HAD superfamily hydrolase